jgi:outer membrane protein assembly factor BamE
MIPSINHSKELQLYKQASIIGACRSSRSNKMNFRVIVMVSLLVSIVTSSACVYRLDIPQGNRIDAEDIAQLEIGMTTRQVEFLLGKPAISDLYHSDVWHYVYYFKAGSNGLIDKRVMTLRFTDDLLSSIEGSLNDS